MSKKLLIDHHAFLMMAVGWGHKTKTPQRKKNRYLGSPFAVTRPRGYNGGGWNSVWGNPAQNK